VPLPLYFRHGNAGLPNRGRMLGDDGRDSRLWVELFSAPLSGAMSCLLNCPEIGHSGWHLLRWARSGRRGGDLRRPPKEGEIQLASASGDDGA